jgi:predicted acyl esterase
MAPNTPARIEWTLNDVSHTFQRGHRLMVQVQSSWFPLVSRNPQSFVPNVETARETDFRRATMRVYHATSMASGLEILVVPKQ